ncbi:hypothetical protein TNCV_712961 [Trichonephila clavipes]|nr:hypothetical protein TNCV_712961 [Trichonephila clavipes]
MQQRSLNSSLEATVGSPLVHLVGTLLNGSTSSLPNSPLQPSVTSITYGPWYTTFATSLILDGPILPCTVQDRLSYEDSNTRFISTRTPLKYGRVLSSDIKPTTDDREKNNGWIPPASRTSSEIRGVRRDHLHPQESGEGVRLKHSKKEMRLPLPSPITYSVELKYSIV